jgi:Mrp family chromosome partitioning ATPase
MLVIESKEISYKLAQKVMKQLEQVNNKVLGVVLNKLENKYNPYWNYKKKFKKYERNYIGIEEEIKYSREE